MLQSCLADAKTNGISPAQETQQVGEVEYSVGLGVCLGVPL